MFLQIQFLVLLFWAAIAASDQTVLEGSASNLTASNQLVAVVQIFRHGHRTPTVFYKNDKYADLSKYWNGLNLGDLTNEGKRQHYRLAMFTRMRYGKWLPQNYNKNDFYAQTTEYDRTHMSGQVNIYGLYPSKLDQRWRLLTDWQPIPLHPGDANIWESIPKCAAYTGEYAKVLASDRYAAINKQYADVYAYLSKYSGNNVTNVEQAYPVFDSFKSESTVGLRLPVWASKVYPEPLRELIGHMFNAYVYTTKQQRLYAGALLDSILNYFDNKINGSVSQKFKMYSGHDLNVAGILRVFGAFNPPYPPDFASSLYLELRNNSGSYFVNAWSKDGSNFNQVSIKGCALDCPLDEVRQRLDGILLDVDTKVKECNAKLEFENVDVENMYKKLTETGEMERLKDLF
ncbi:venom acid phosphatase Acph-1-like isoform X1 [Diabrotica virgifera virgifera]|uniref:acid phosphatase n=1 Tax=Diabrotica virgifera virgifera TaxID=50390 RepID=A0A6P7GI27_DIAVI|nr:venom acid phosphatase Acph-1-like isoform X1 [Diabrotica virgifera virgifera]